MIPGLGRPFGEGKGYPLQYPGLENSMDCILHGVTKSRTRPTDFFTKLQEAGEWWVWDMVCFEETPVPAKLPFSLESLCVLGESPLVERTLQTKRVAQGPRC